MPVPGSRARKLYTKIQTIVSTYNSHTHGGVTTGSDNTGTPNQTISS